MQSLTSVQALRQARKNWRNADQKVGFVPTMGNLHNGHLQLVRAAKEHCDVVVVSIFVNPMQFGKNEDLDAYPRTLDEDKAKLEALGVEALFLPTVSEMYPRGLAKQTYVEVPGLSHILCGTSRPGHFRGVATIVCKLFNMVSPDMAFFGEKDFQQLQIIRLMAQDLSMPITIKGVPIEREESGLAMSSRNGYLNESQRACAPSLYRLIIALKEDIKGGKRDYAQLIEAYTAQIEQAGFKPDYLAISDAETLTAADENTTDIVILVAAYLGNTRLIDNLSFTR
ncbi:pantoate--beta-alanine ligase [Alteromonas sp. C1M14]|uniref:pantoate--beta-alanine ligase n=1 Tax=Alteromonas sp. C1M14 TaxID=2841567 RepID=UPI001C09653F|nr:pantoate--beta-alanine ligase [Alteromonas sp. C1M14]MBU2977323.1 pantoate--beta-alanine ligase [Alteromonas sp. C1M14]